MRSFEAMKQFIWRYWVQLWMLPGEKTAPRSSSLSRHFQFFLASGLSINIILATQIFLTRNIEIPAVAVHVRISIWGLVHDLVGIDKVKQDFVSLFININISRNASFFQRLSTFVRNDKILILF